MVTAMYMVMEPGQTGRGDWDISDILKSRCENCKKYQETIRKQGQVIEKLLETISDLSDININD